DPFIDEALRELDRIWHSNTFKHVEKGRHLLGFVVAITLLKREHEISAKTIARHVWKLARYEVEQSTVKVAALGLRDKLEEYYKGEGKNDPIEIQIPIGGYVPEIVDRWPTIAVSQFHDWFGDRDHCCATIRNEIVHQLNLAGGVRAKRVTRLDE